jgi:hypothetical protein
VAIPRRTGAARRLTDSPNDLLSEPALEMGDRPPQGLTDSSNDLLSEPALEMGDRPPQGLTDFACDACCRIEVISGGACRSGVGYPIIISIPRSLVVVRTCRSALNMLNVCEWRVGLLCYISVNASCRSCSSGCSHAQPQHKSSNSALYSAIYDIIHLRESRLELSQCLYRANRVDQCFVVSCEDIGVETRKIACKLLACDCPLHKQ